MSKKRRKNRDDFSDVPVPAPKVAYVLGSDFENLCAGEYTSLDKCPDIMTACRTYVELIGSMTIYLMSNTKNGDVRITNALSRQIDITPEINMNRSEWMESIIMTLMLYGKGNAVVVPHTWEGLLRSLR